ncbi:sensor histidine kinase [Flavobacterium caeni]|uniref:histidine kinase n=1 Tax=Flavobacterium caeni TaxID=490189 RepID=A0A1G5D031_9FLAO|nr:ATP-binding protein [Flavobacterium caeni]SCY08045.1 Histidine kinase [Flavobacterium caeni]
MFEPIAFGIIIGLMFVSLIVLFNVLLVKLYIRKVKTYTAQLYQKDLDHQKSLTGAIIETQEQVFNNISADLHDDAGQQLTYINFQIENLKLDSVAMQRDLQPLSESVRKLSDSIRSISHSLNNQLIVRQDLVKAIGAEVERLRKNPKLDLTFSVKGEPRDFSVDEKIVIYRIFQEIINNTLKHAAASHISVRIRLNPLFEMQVTDNGKGFSADRIESKTTLGLQNMATRATGIGYHIDIISEPGNGTRVTLSENNPT